MKLADDPWFYLKDAVHVLQSNGTVEHADACARAYAILCGPATERCDMAKKLSRAPEAPLRRTYDAAIAGFCANPNGLRPHEIIEMALDVCIEDLGSESPGWEKPEREQPF